MKANEAPEKIYVNFHFIETHPGSSPLVTKQGVNKYDVVYTRTDAFVEKAVSWLKENADKCITIKDGTIQLGIGFYINFKRAMKGE